uniref:Glycosyltransferase n=1 Tax=Araucaria cunninghamii TaxID=56994 RepID=A0A0D6QU70_ARACU
MAPHVVVIPWPTQGHINPLIRLSEKLASEGVIITFVNTEANHSRIIRARNSHNGIPVDPISNIRFVQISDGLPPDFNPRANREHALRAIMTTMRNSAEALLLDLRTAASEPPISCVIGSSFLHWTFSVAKKFGLPWVAFWPQSASVYAIFRHLPIIISNGDFPPQNQGPEDTIDYIPGLPPLHPQDLPDNIQNGDSSSFLHQLVVEQWPALDEARWIIGNTVYELESEASDAVAERAPLISLGPFLPPAYLEAKGNNEDFSVVNPRSLSLWAESNCLPWLDSKPKSSVLYVSFGSVYQMSKSQVQEVARGLLESEQQFLWVIRPDLVSSGEPNIEGHVLPEGFVEKTKARGLVVPWSPQLLVLSHPAIGGFFTHGGWNSTVESLSLGVPMLVFPLGADQYTNRMLVVSRLKVGLKLERCRDDGIVEGAEISRCVRAVLADGEMRRNSREVKETIRKAAGVGGSSWKNMKDFVDYLMLGDSEKKRDEVGDN